MSAGPRRSTLLLALLALLVAGLAGAILVPRIALRVRIERLTSDDPEERADALRALLEEPHRDAIVPFLRALARDPALNSEEWMGSHPEQLFSAERLASRVARSPRALDAESRDEAIRQLTTPPPDGPSAPQDTRPRSMDVVAWFADRLALPDAALVELLRPLLAEENESALRSHAALVAGDLGPSARGLIPTLLNCLASEDRVLEHAAALALGQIGLPAAILEDVIERIVEYPLVRRLGEPDEAEDTLHALARGLEIPRALDVLAGMLEDADPLRRERACRLAIAMGNEFALALAIVGREDGTRTPDDLIARYAREALRGESVRIARTIERLGPGLSREILCRTLRDETLPSVELAPAALPHLAVAFPRLGSRERLDVASCLGPIFWSIDSRASELAPMARDAIERLTGQPSVDAHRIDDAVGSLRFHAAPLFPLLLERAVASGTGDITEIASQLFRSREEEMRALRQVLAGPASEDAKTWARSRTRTLEYDAMVASAQRDERTVPRLLDVLKRRTSSPFRTVSAAEGLLAIDPAGEAPPDPRLIRALAHAHVRFDGELDDLLVALVRLGAADVALAFALEQVDPVDELFSLDSERTSPHPDAELWRELDLSLDVVRALKPLQPEDVRKLLAQTGDLTPERLDSMEAALREPVTAQIVRIRRHQELFPSYDTVDAIRAVGALGPRASSYTPALVELLRGSEPGSSPRHEAARALAGVGAGSASTAAHLASLLVERADRLVALEALRELGPSARTVLPRIVDALEDLDYRVRYEATRLLGELAPDDPRVVAALAARLGDLHASIRAAAALALADIGREAPERIDESVRRTLAAARDEDIDERVRTECARALAGLGEDR